MHIYITGATGLLGSELTRQLLKAGHQITVVSRSVSSVQNVFGDSVQALTWDAIEQQGLHDGEVYIHLAGKSIMSLPRNHKNKKAIWNSRILTTQKLVSQLPTTCHTFICASASGYYPPSDTVVYDTSYINHSPQGFLDTLCVAREHEAHKAATEERRVVNLRTGLVIGPGTFEDTLKKVTKRTGGTILGKGSQILPLISKEQWVKGVIHCIEKKEISGPVSLVERNISYKQFTQELAQSKKRPVLRRIPGFFLKMILGEAAILFLGSWHIVPMEDVKSGQIQEFPSSQKKLVSKNIKLEKVFRKMC